MKFIGQAQTAWDNVEIRPAGDPGQVMPVTEHPEGSAPGTLEREMRQTTEALQASQNQQPSGGMKIVTVAAIGLGIAGLVWWLRR